MVYFYNVALVKRPIGTAIEYREPPLRGRVLIKVSEIQTSGDHRLIVIDCDDDQHRANATLPGVSALSENDAIQLAARYQPARTVTQFNPQTRKSEQVSLPALDLRPFYTPAK